jgi:acyl-CoA reductase-like NAD-dependent aldehyde dehydrogenase
VNDPVESIVRAAREAQPEWEATPLAQRLRVVRGVRHDIGRSPRAWAEAIGPLPGRSVADSLAAEVGPVADACRFTCRVAPRVLRPRVAREGLLAAMLSGVRTVVERKPLGVVLVIGASNYPLFLLAIPAVQALATGNAVLLKPPPGGERVAELLADALVEAGLDPTLCGMLGSDPAAAQRAIAAGVDQVIATGSSATGRAVAQAAVERLTPCTLECSGSDPVIVLPGASARRVADCISWGLQLNGGATCIAPRRLIVDESLADAVLDRLFDRLAATGACEVPPAVAERVREAIGAELNAGGRLLSPADFDRATLAAACDAGRLPPLLLSPGLAPSVVSRSDLFAPVLTFEVAQHNDDAVALANDSPFALGASVFGPPRAARRVASRLRAGCVTVNDLIAPTADPRVPFGGAGESGYGVTRGAEGLLAMTRPQAIVRRRGRWLPHLDEPRPLLDDLLSGMVQLNHARGVMAKFAGLQRLIAAATGGKARQDDRMERD